MSSIIKIPSSNFIMNKETLAENVISPHLGVELAHSVYDYDFLQIKQIHNTMHEMWSGLFTVHPEETIYKIPHYVFALNVTVVSETNIKIQCINNSDGIVNSNTSQLFSIYGYKFISKSCEFLSEPISISCNTVVTLPDMTGIENFEQVDIKFEFTYSTEPEKKQKASLNGFVLKEADITRVGYFQNTSMTLFNNSDGTYSISFDTDDDKYNNIKILSIKGVNI